MSSLGALLLDIITNIDMALARNCRLLHIRQRKFLPAARPDLARCIACPQVFRLNPHVCLRLPWCTAPIAWPMRTRPSIWLGFAPVGLPRSNAPAQAHQSIVTETQEETPAPPVLLPASEMPPCKRASGLDPGHLLVLSRLLAAWRKVVNAPPCSSRVDPARDVLGCFFASLLSIRRGTLFDVHPRSKTIVLIAGALMLIFPHQGECREHLTTLLSGPATAHSWYAVAYHLVERILECPAPRSSAVSILEPFQMHRGTQRRRAASMLLLRGKVDSRVSTQRQPCVRGLRVVKLFRSTYQGGAKHHSPPCRRNRRRRSPHVDNSLINPHSLAQSPWPRRPFPQRTALPSPSLHPPRPHP